jgi:hypothetical protein
MGFVNRKKSGNIIGGSRLVVNGQNIFNVQVIPPGFNKLSSKQDNDSYVEVSSTPIPTPTITPTPSMTPTSGLSPTPSNTPTNTETPTSTPTPTPTPTSTQIVDTNYLLQENYFTLDQENNNKILIN